MIQRHVVVTFCDGRTQTVRTVPDTPEGRVRAEKVAGEWYELEKVASVSVVPVGAGAPKAPAVSSEEQRNPVPSRATGCCTPGQLRKPSGIRFCHAFDCKSAPGEIYEGPIPDISAARLNRQHRIQTRRTGLDEAIADHPAGGTLTAYDEFCPAHRSEPVEECIVCSERWTG